MKEITIEITNYCEFACEYCSTNANDTLSPLSSSLSPQVIEEFIEKENPDVINISGGEPLAHPEFYKILTYCKSKADKVWVYTNEISHIRFNSDILPEGIEVHANVVIKEGKRFIPPADKVHLLELQEHGRAVNLNKVDFKVSGDNCEECNHKVLQANGKLSKPCNKDY